MKNFDDQAFSNIHDDEVEIVDLDAANRSKQRSNRRQIPRLSSRTRVWLAFSTLVAVILLFILILKPGLPSPAPPPAKPGAVSLSLPASARAAQVSSENGIVFLNQPDGIIYALKASDGALLWHFKAPTRVSMQVIDQVVYLIPVNQSGVYGFVMALLADDGKVLWGQSIPYPGPVAPVISDGIIYVSGHDGDVIYALRARDGFQIWQFGVNQFPDFPPPFVSIEEKDGFVYLLSAENVLYVLRASDGYHLWSYRYKTYEANAGLPTIEDGIAYLNGQDGAIAALSASTGLPLWQYHPGAGPLWPALVQDGVVYVSEKGGTMSVLNGSNGTALHDYKNIGIVTSQPVVQNGILYINAADGWLEAFKASDGSLLWRYKPPAFILWPPQIVNNTVYIISPGGPNLMDKVLTALQASNGSLLWSYETGSLNYLLFRPGITGNIAYISLDNTSMEALSLHNGTLLWYYQSPTPILFLSAYNGTIYISSQDGRVNALQASNGALQWHFP
ncbi:MAG TPA: PQQ-binding-like beta-propeller repeat protein [Ktedonobacteraceae bacterium]|nr:PQQ-binding-like beta-propeller repeat protein [Ktedonobacteraceae bacterium]